MFFLFKQKTAYEMRISDWSSDVCSSDLLLGSVHLLPESVQPLPAALDKAYGSADTLVFESDLGALDAPAMQRDVLAAARGKKGLRSEEHTSELQSLMRNSYAVFCLNKKRIFERIQTIYTWSNQKE